MGGIRPNYHGDKKVRVRMGHVRWSSTGGPIEEARNYVQLTIVFSTLGDSTIFRPSMVYLAMGQPFLECLAMVRPSILCPIAACLT